ncbi:MAG: response regulator [Bacteroidales bacterium]|nr:response regulator [Bacteroidales bacterium]
MIRSNIITAFTLFLVLALNGTAILHVNQRYNDYLNRTLFSQSRLYGEHMETTLLQFSSDINQELNKYDYSEIFKDPEKFQDAKRGIRLFFTKYRDLVTRISVYDNRKNFFALYLEVNNNFGKEDVFVVDSFTTRRQMDLSVLERVEQNGSKLEYHYPYFGPDIVEGNVVVQVDLQRFTERAFKLYPQVSDRSWQWVLDSDGQIIIDNFRADTILVEDLQLLSDSINAEASGIIEHLIIGVNGGREKVQTAYYPISIYSRKMGVMLSLGKGEIYRLFVRNNLIIGILTQLLITGLVVYLLLLLGRQKRSEKKLMLSETVLRQIIEHFPMGILIIDKQNIIRNMNSAGQRMLFLGKASDLVGKDFSKQFLVSNKYLLSDGPSPFMDDSHYLYYEKDGMETVIYRSEKTANIGGEELRLIALIDVSPLERSRKGEVAANKAKSDFLAAMSHEIRTPMNGILGMVNSLLEQKENKELQGKIQVIKRSAELLMTIINDILDFSKIEAGRMMLEEIPFNLNEEMGLVVELFKPLAEEKGLKLYIDIRPDVPNKLIGDPFRLRQVISNLISNSVKFTEKGKIVIGVTLMESFKNHVNILFTVEDTGIGIPKDRIKEIFGSYTQARGSVQRKFGGTGLGTAIAKQLVELMHGEIWVESPSTIKTDEEYPGSKFSFTIEAYSNERIPKLFDYNNIARLSEINVLILTKESDPERNSMARMLQKFGLNVITKIYQDSTVDSVIHHLQVKSADYQMIVLVDKNQLDGFALAQGMKTSKLIDHYPVVLVSSNDKTGNYKTCRKLGIDYYLIEPFETKEVIDILDEIYPGIEDRKVLEPMINALPEELSILLAEDNLINQKVAQSIFKNIGYEIEIAKNGTEAVEMVEKQKFDIIFMDLLMPEMDGYQATEKIREAGYTLPIIAMSADETNDTRRAAFEAGMNDYVMKPARVEGVKQLLIKLFSKTI